MTDAMPPDLTGFAKARERYLAENWPDDLKEMEADGTLAFELNETAQAAQTLFKKTANELKAQVLESPMPFEARVKALQQAHVLASELVMAEVIEAPLRATGRSSSSMEKLPA